MLLTQLEYVEEVARAKSFNKAAKNLFLSQSALSIAVRNLEKELHLTIFERSNQGVRLTPEGEEVLVVINGILTGTKKLSQLSTKLSSNEVLLVCPVFNKLYSSVINDFPDTSFLINESSSPEIFEKVSSGVVPFGIASFVSPFIENILLYKSLIVTSLFQDIFYLVMSNKNPLVNKEIIFPSDLSGAVLSVFSNQTPASDYSYWSGYSNEFSSVHSFHHVSSLIDNVKNTSGITILSGSAIQAYGLRNDKELFIRELSNFRNKFQYVLLTYSGVASDLYKEKHFNEFKKYMQSFFS